MNQKADITVWYPEDESRAPQHARSVSFLDYCLSRKPARDFADRKDFTAESLMPWLGHLMLLDFHPDREDFRYRLYGSDIAARTGFDMTGKWVSDFRSGIGALYREQYTTSIRERCIIASRNPYLHSRAPCDWERIICPVARPEGAQLVVSNHMVELTGPVHEFRNEHVARG